MEIVSDRYTQRVKRGPKEIEYLAPGTVFECPDEIAREKIASGRFRRPTATDRAKAEEAETATGPDSDEGQVGELDEVVAAILELEEGEANYLGDGRPRTGALSKALGRTVSAEERDRAWAELQDDGSDD